ncbi:cytochrome P450 [Crucibulum laeve]|uniref:Cytochrome P450 n=1 Tax=Crucibulum laeve TaxID=68775 RepID=A0A5C3M3Y3_9AGAR|nr:cytochrome P450 [Crucibulum laeve]
MPALLYWGYNLLRSSAISLCLLLVLFYTIRRLFYPPAALHHLPCVPILPLLLSYARKESDDIRIKNLILPYALSKGEGIVLVYAIGMWVVHILDIKVIKDVAEDLGNWPKSALPPDMLFVRLVGDSNVVISNGETWKKHSTILQRALNQNLPIEQFTILCHKLFKKMGEGGVLKWDDLTMKFALDAVGTSVLGYDFDAIENDRSPFLEQYVRVMEGIASPLHLLWPRLEALFPRYELIHRIDALVRHFQEILEYKQVNKGNDLLTYMLEEPSLTQKEYRDNMQVTRAIYISYRVAFFIAGHDTTAGAMASLVYYLAKYPEYQEEARREALEALGEEEPNFANLAKMPFVNACIKEALRINSPVANTAPRTSRVGSTVKTLTGKTYYIPADTTALINLISIHANASHWDDVDTFNPDRFINDNQAKGDATTWIPFSRGPRQCPARNFAMYELRTVAALLLQNWEWTLPSGSPHFIGVKNSFSPFALSSPKDLHINFMKRSYHV